MSVCQMAVLKVYSAGVHSVQCRYTLWNLLFEHPPTINSYFLIGKANNS